MCVAVSQNRSGSASVSSGRFCPPRLAICPLRTLRPTALCRSQRRWAGLGLRYIRWYVRAVLARLAYVMVRTTLWWSLTSSLALSPFPSHPVPLRQFLSVGPRPGFRSFQMDSLSTFKCPVWLCWCWRHVAFAPARTDVSLSPRRTGRARPHSGCVESSLPCEVTQKIENSMQLVIGLRFRDFAVSAVCSGPQLTSLKLWLCSEMTTTSFAERRGRWGPTFSVDDFPCSSERPRCTLRVDFCISPFGLFQPRIQEVRHFREPNVTLALW